MKKDIEYYVKHCVECQRRKLVRVKHREPMVITDTPTESFQKISIDIYGPLPVTRSGNKNILTIQDNLTKYSVAIPIAETTSKDVATALARKFICIYGTPKVIISDRGTNFMSEIFREFTKMFRIKHFRTTAYHPQSNGSLERSHHVLTEYLKQFVDRHRDWDYWVPSAMFSYNTSTHEGTKFSPYELVFGKRARIPSQFDYEPKDRTYDDFFIDLVAKMRKDNEKARNNLIKAKQRSKRYYDRRVKKHRYEIGDDVWLEKPVRHGKFDDEYVGPYRITEILPHNNVRIRTGPNKGKTVHVDKIKYYYE